MISLPVQSNSSGQITRAVYRDSEYIFRYEARRNLHDVEFRTPQVYYFSFVSSVSDSLSVRPQTVY